MNTLPNAYPVLLLQERDGTKGTIELKKKNNEFSNGFDVNLPNAK